MVKEFQVYERLKIDKGTVGISCKGLEPMYIKVGAVPKCCLDCSDCFIEIRRKRLARRATGSAAGYLGGEAWLFTSFTHLQEPAEHTDRSSEA
ncbi:hypothetical protein JCM15765_13690 [Paradesulfitobacterium aromaticivorans]